MFAWRSRNFFAKKLKLLKFNEVSLSSGNWFKRNIFEHDRTQKAFQMKSDQMQRDRELKWSVIALLLSVSHSQDIRTRMSEYVYRIHQQLKNFGNWTLDGRTAFHHPPDPITGNFTRISSAGKQSNTVTKERSFGCRETIPLRPQQTRTSSEVGYKISFHEIILNTRQMGRFIEE